MARFQRLGRVSLVSALLAVSLISCSDTGNSTTKNAGSRAQQDADVPEFSRPWADLFRSAYSAATTDLQRTILADEKITDQENNEVRAAFVSCMAGFNIQVELQERDSIKSQAPAGMTDEKYEEISKECRAKTSSQISGLYFQISRNPENKDEFAIMADCLSRSGLVEKGYSAKDYASGFSAQDFPFDETDPRYRACGLDPLSLDSAAR